MENLAYPALRDALLTHAARGTDAAGVAATAFPGVSVIWAATPGEIDYAISSPLVALVLQGRKEVTLGAQCVAMGPGDSLLISADIPTLSQITMASAAEPYCAFVLHLDPAIIAALLPEVAASAAPPGAPLVSTPTEAEMAETALRLMRLHDHPSALPVLGPQILRELHYWLLIGPQGMAIRQLGQADSHSARIARAVAVLRRDFTRPLPVERLAETAGMSLSSFHHHFRAATSLSPLQFQKQLRLIEARRVMLAEGRTAAGAAYAVGYESVPQFTRDYGRMFGRPPARDVDALRAGLAQAG